MTRACSTMLRAAALLMLASSPLDAQTPATGQLRVGPTFAGRARAPQADRINLISVENRVSGVEGSYVEMSVVQIDSVLSPRVFTVRRPLRPHYESFDANRPVLLLVEAPLPALRRGALVQVTGWVATVPSATAVIGGDWGGELDEDILEDTNRPLVIANVVRSMDGMELASRQ